MLSRLSQGKGDALSEQDLESCLRLTKMWCFDDLRDVAISKLGRVCLIPSRKIELAHIHDIRHWYRPVLKELALCNSALTPSKVSQIGPEFALMVYRLKEKKLEVIMRSGFHSPTKTKTVSGRSIEEYNMVQIQKEFDVLLDSFAQVHHWDD